MFKVNDIKELIRAVDRSSIGELSIKGENNTKLTIKKQGVDFEISNVPSQPVATTTIVEQAKPQEVSVPSPAPAQTQVETKIEEQDGKAQAESLHKIVSPMVGTFYAAPSPDADPYVKVGDKVTSDSVVCIVEAMKLMNELEAEVSGEIVEILVENGQLVEYGQPLFLVKE